MTHGCGGIAWQGFEPSQVLGGIDATVPAIGQRGWEYASSVEYENRLEQLMAFNDACLFNWLLHLPGQDGSLLNPEHPDAEPYRNIYVRGQEEAPYCDEQYQEMVSDGMPPGEWAWERFWHDIGTGITSTGVDRIDSSGRYILSERVLADLPVELQVRARQLGMNDDDPFS